MKFEYPLTEGRLIRRYKRFLADVELENGEMVTAHCMNSGSMMGLKEPGSRVWLSPATNPEAKLKWKWELVEAGDALVGINTGHPNKLAEEAIESGRIPALAGYQTIRREVKYGENSRIDLLLEDHDDASPAYVEVKNVTLKRKGAAEFPDAVTSRGAKHLRELARVAEAGKRAVMLYVAQRGDCTHFTIAGDIDPGYAEALELARAAGVELLAFACAMSTEEIRIEAPLEIRI
ncbi:MAG: DNA/RNA nuclease SfsA [Alphaproteobacteria bacterium]|nr:MAG: DNA/RNA nuclease SfsA [Alphaproteobacteria bacterium]